MQTDLLWGCRNHLSIVNNGYGCKLGMNFFFNLNSDKNISQFFSKQVIRQSDLNSFCNFMFIFLYIMSVALCASIIILSSAYNNES